MVRRFLPFLRKDLVLPTREIGHVFRLLRFVVNSPLGSTFFATSLLLFLKCHLNHNSVDFDVRVCVYVMCRCGSACVHLRRRLD